MTTSNLGLAKLLTSSKGVTLAPRGPTVACDGIFCSVGKDFVAQCECLVSDFGIEKLFLQRKKFFKLKLRENSDHRHNENIFFKKRFN